MTTLESLLLSALLSEDEEHKTLIIEYELIDSIKDQYYDKRERTICLQLTY